MRLLTFSALTAVLVVLLASAPAQAAGGAASKLYVKNEFGEFRPASTAEVEAAGQAAESEDKLGFLGLKRYDLGIWTLVVFAILIVVLAKYAWPHIKTGLAKREDNIRGALEEAKKEREEAKVSLVEAKRQIDETSLKVKGMLDDARKQADALKVTEREAGAKDAQAERERAKREAEALKDSLSKEVYDQ